MKFDWNSNKAKKNVRKHDITFEEASTIFGDPLSITIDDPQHSDREERLIIIGCSTNMKTLVVSHIDDGDTVRIISARKATKKEREYYEKI